MQHKRSASYSSSRQKSRHKPATRRRQYLGAVDERDILGELVRGG